MKIVYGGIYRHGRTFTASYFDISKDDLSGNVIEIKDGFSVLSNSDIPEKICVWSLPTVKPEEFEQKVAFNYDLKLSRY